MKTAACNVARSSRTTSATNAIAVEWRTSFSMRNMRNTGNSDRSQPAKKNCHITAIGADSPGKQELETALVARADLRVADNLAQSLDHGEFAHARAAGLIGTGDCMELGAVLAGTTARRSPGDITIADLTGVATQDIAMARLVLSRAKAAP